MHLVKEDMLTHVHENTGKRLMTRAKPFASYQIMPGFITGEVAVTRRSGCKMKLAKILEKQRNSTNWGKISSVFKTNP